MRYNRNVWLFATMMAMPVSLFLSRGLLSASMIAFLVVSIFHRDIKQQLYDFFSTPLLCGMTVLFLLPLASGLWSEDKETWMQLLQIKLPLLFLPLGFAGKWKFPESWWTWSGYLFLGIATIASAWTFFHYIGNLSAVHDSYLQARTMITPLANDHVRFSWFLSIAALLSAYFFSIYREKDRWLSILFLVALAWFVVFLHILAARTGLLSLYIMMGVAGAWLVVRQMKWMAGLGLVAVMIILPVAAYKLMPSFRNRVNYVRYELGYFREANYLAGSNDAVRVISWKAGWALLSQNPGKGVGYGDIAMEAGEWYPEHYPGMMTRDRIYPSNQWLMYGAGCGVAGILFFSFCMVVPFFTPVNNRLLWWMLNGTAAAAFLFDIGLEVQFGVFIYSYMILWWFRWLGKNEQ